LKTDTFSRKDFVPIAEITGRDNGHTVLLFITSFNVQHHNRSDDPIFPARKQINSPPSGNPDLDDLKNYWTNNETHSSVLGCVEYALLCRNESRSSCYDPWTSSPPIPNMSDAEYITFMGLLHSGFWSTIQSRTSKELDATRKIVDVSISMPLDPHQWKVEARRIFEMQMVRARWEVLEVARGTRSSMAGFVNFLDRKRVCQMIKFQSTGYKNLSLFGVLLSTILPPLLAVPVRKKRPLILWPLYLLRWALTVRSDDLRTWKSLLQQSAREVWKKGAPTRVKIRSAPRDFLLFWRNK
jgi:hypothetical protein